MYTQFFLRKNSKKKIQMGINQRGNDTKMKENVKKCEKNRRQKLSSSIF